MLRCSTFAVVLMLIAALTIAGCGGSGGSFNHQPANTGNGALPTPAQAASQGHITVQVRLSDLGIKESRGGYGYSLHYTLASQAGPLIERNIEFVNDVASYPETLHAGSWLLDAELTDGNVVAMTGSTSFMIFGGQTTNVTLALVPLTGQATINFTGGYKSKQ